MITDRIDNITNIPKAFQGVKLPVPPSVKVELTGRCNLQCWFCATGQNLREKANMDIRFYKKLVRELKELGVRELGLFYLGESLLCPWIVEAIQFAKHEVGFSYVFLTTNGLLAQSKLVEDMMAAGLDSLKFSFNFANRTEYIEATKVDGFEKTIDNIREAWMARGIGEYNCNLYASSIYYNRAFSEKMKETLERILPYVDQHYWLPLYSQAGQIAKDGQRFTAGVRGRYHMMRDPLPCWAVFREGHVTFDGFLSACCFDHDRRFAIGDLNKEDFMTAWNSETAQKLRTAHLAQDVTGTVCENCIAYKGA